MKRVVWIGPVVSPSRVSSYSAVSAAGNSWQLRVIKHLSKNVNIEILSYIPDSIWPKGKLFRSSHKYKIDNISITQTGYLNLPNIREIFLGQSLVRQLEEINRNESIDLVITYNALKHHVIAGEHLKTLGVKWVSVIADDFARGKPDLSVFLSYDYFNRYNGQKTFFEGLVKDYVPNEITNPERKILMYTGSISIWTGISQFAEVFKKLELQNVELHIYGKDSNGNAGQLEGKGVFYKGFVDDHELDAAMKDSYAFINPRPMNVLNGDNNFPSKILDYLAYGKPIISTVTKGVPEYYSEVLIKYDNNEINDIKQVLDYVLTLDIEELSEIKRTCRRFISSQKERSFFSFIEVLLG